MRISDLQQQEFINYINELLTTKQVYEMEKYIQHGNTTTFTHCLVVAYYSYVTAIHLPIAYDLRSIVRGAMLHDFYLYDWHIPSDSHKLHGFHHPRFALKNARRHFQLNPVEEDIIIKHMWPLTVTKLPLYKESLLVLLIDKYCSLVETLYLPLLPKDFKRILRKLTSCSPTS